MKKNILFLCTGNSCRSQMAEGWGRKLKSEQYHFYSAGIEQHGLNPFAVKVMAESGVDISKYKSSLVSEFDQVDFDLVITVCSHADENCPIFSKAKVIHHSFDDPPSLTKNIQSEDEILAIYRRVRDEIKDFVSSL